MYLWWVNYYGEEWGCYVIAKTRGKAKLMFGSYFGTGEWNDIRSTRLKVANGYAAALLDDADDPRLKELGVKYVDPDEMEDE